MKAESYFLSNCIDGHNGSVTLTKALHGDILTPSSTLVFTTAIALADAAKDPIKRVVLLKHLWLTAQLQWPILSSLTHSVIPVSGQGLKAVIHICTSTVSPLVLGTVQYTGG